MPKELNLEVKVGAFVVIAVVAIVGFVFSISDFSTFQKGTTYTVIFQYANGLKKGAPVRIAGVDSGHVRDLKVSYDMSAHVSRVSIDIWLMHGTTIPIDSTFMINQLGMLGEKYLEIMPGTAIEFVKPGSFLAGETPVPMETIMKKLSGIALKLDDTLSGLNNGVLNEVNKKAISETLANVAAITGALKEGEGTIGQLLKDKSVYENLMSITGSINNGEGTFGMLLKDKSIYQNLDELTADLKAHPWKLFYRPRNAK
jgi:phospholipid/cholesterol/gamma-HCH transport system substrate-binding protein